MILDAYPTLASLSRNEKIALIKELALSMRVQPDEDGYHATRQAADDLTAIFHRGKQEAIERWESTKANQG